MAIAWGLGTRGDAPDAMAVFCFGTMAARPGTSAARPVPPFARQCGENACFALRNQRKLFIGLNFILALVATLLKRERGTLIERPPAGMVEF
jgi:hypothetical protein